MLRVCFAGVTGWTAPPILDGIAAADDLLLVAGVSRSAAGRTLAEVTGAGDGLVYASVAEALKECEFDILVDYTSAATVRDHAFAAVAAGVHVVVGSSGLTGADYAELDALARERGVGVVAAGNFSLLAAVLVKAAILAAEQVPSWEIIDYASATKPDVPSGTARELAEVLGQVRTPQVGVPIDQLQGPTQARGAEVGGSRVHSVRLPGFVIATEVVFGSGGEKLVMNHDPGAGPEPYAPGTLLAVRRVAEQPGLRRGLHTLLFP
jgi:4-hydroxy-tetrahydrodipicolinate reductase